MPRKPPTFIPKHERDAVVADLRRLQNDQGVLSDDVLTRYAVTLGVSVRSVRRWLHDPAGPTQREPAYQLGDEHLALIAAEPTLKAAWRRLHDQGDPVPSYPHFTRLVNDVDPARLAGARKGRAAMHNQQLYIPQQARSRNDQWQIDHLYLPMRVTWPGFRNPVAPIQTTILDTATRIVVATAVWPGNPDAVQTLAVVAKAVHGRGVDGQFVGGLPCSLQSDRGAELTGEVMARGLIRLGITADPTRSYGPWEKGAIERWHRTINEELYATLPGYTGGPRNYVGDTALAVTPGELLTRDQLLAHLHQWVGHYNTARPHQALNGVTPLQAWRADTAPVREADPQRVADCALHEQRRRRRTGVQLHNREYSAAALGLIGVGADVEVATLPDETGFVWVKVEGQWHQAGTADQLTETEIGQIQAHRAAVERQVTADHKAARAIRAADAALLPRQGDGDQPPNPAGPGRRRRTSRVAAAHTPEELARLGMGRGATTPKEAS